MFLNAASPRRSFGIPIDMNLQGAGRRQARGADAPEGQRARAQMLVPSVGEDRALLLGFTMMVFSVLMLFVVGITTVKPYYVSSNWEEASCAVLHTEILEEWVDCRGVSTVPCLRVRVNLTGSNQTAFLHFDEELVLQALEVQIEGTNRRRTSVAVDCRSGFKHCRGTQKEQLTECLMINNTDFCHSLLVVLVKLTQCLAHLSAEMCSETAGGRLTSRHTRRKLSRLLRKSS
uniref:Uncharacterized protein n=1 Tax=Mola mola TaxID=94237 RepID=A0A3Q3XKF3_MOLML